MQGKFKSMLRSSSFCELNQRSRMMETCDSVELEELSLINLKKQREKIEKLVRQNEILEQKLKKEVKDNNILKQKIEELQQSLIDSQLYYSLKDQHEKLLYSLQAAEFQIQELKNQLEKSVTASLLEEDELIKQLKREKDEKKIKLSYFQSILVEKDSEIAKLTIKIKENKQRYEEKINSLSQQYSSISKELKQAKKQYKQTEGILKKQVITRQNDNCNIQRMIDRLRKENKSLKLQLVNQKGQNQRTYQQMNSLLLQRECSIHNITKQNKAIESQNHHLKESISRLQKQMKQMKQNIQKREKNYSKLNRKQKSQTKSLLQAKDQTINRLQKQLIRLKKNLQVQVQEYNLLSIQFKKCRQILEQKIAYQKKTRLLISSPFRQIDNLNRLHNQKR